MEALVQAEEVCLCVVQLDLHEVGSRMRHLASAAAVCVYGALNAYNGQELIDRWVWWSSNCW